MSCIICLDDDAAYACECSAFHVHCFATFLARGHDECSVCHARFDPRMKAAALDLLNTRTSRLLGPAHPAAMARKLEMAIAFAEIGRDEVATRCLHHLISFSVESEWINAVSQLELARIMHRQQRSIVAALMLEELVSKLVCIKQRWAWLEHLEACTLLGACYSSLGRFAEAEKLLLFVIGSHLKDENACSRRVVKCMQEIAGFYSSKDNFVLACETHRAAVHILESEEQDPSRVALANLELAKAEIRSGEVSPAIGRLIASIRTLRKRKHDSWAADALPEARKELAKVIKPSKRLRVKTLPEDC
jgi:tetratricopeptide (TPR) repeat protein